MNQLSRSGEASKGRAKSKRRKSSNHGSVDRIFRHRKRELADTSFHFHRFLLIVMLKKYFPSPGLFSQLK